MGWPPIYRRPNPLMFPGRAPGFDQTHPASEGFSRSNAGFSAIPLKSNFVNLLTAGKAALVNNGGSAKMTQGGPGIVLPLSSTAAYTFTESATINATGNTAATIIYYTTGGNEYTVFNGNGFGYGFRILSNAWAIVNNGFVVGPSLTLLSNTLYFMAASFKQNVPYPYVVMNLTSGLLQSGTVTSGTTPAFSTTFAIGNNLGGNTNSYATGAILAAMWSPCFLTLPQLEQWATSPWDFWYPPRVEELIFLSLSGKANTARSFAGAFG